MPACSSHTRTPPPSPLPAGSNWLLTGSSRGFLDLWDVRFQLRVNSWQHPTKAGIDALAPATASPARLGLREAQLGGRPLVYVAAGQNEVGLWDLVDCKCHQVGGLLAGEGLVMWCCACFSAWLVPRSHQCRLLGWWTAGVALSQA